MTEMTNRLRPLILLLTLVCLTAWAQPAAAARLASISGEAGAEEVRQAATFKLGEQDELTISYNITKTGDACNVQVRLYRKQGDEWRVVNVVHQTKETSRGSKRTTLPAGDYKIEVVATDARFSVTVDN